MQIEIIFSFYYIEKTHHFSWVLIWSVSLLLLSFISLFFSRSLSPDLALSLSLYLSRKFSCFCLSLFFRLFFHCCVAHRVRSAAFNQFKRNTLYYLNGTFAWSVWMLISWILSATRSQSTVLCFQQFYWIAVGWNACKMIARKGSMYFNIISTYTHTQKTCEFFNFSGDFFLLVFSCILSSFAFAN